MPRSRDRAQPPAPAAQPPAPDDSAPQAAPVEVPAEAPPAKKKAKAAPKAAAAPAPLVEDSALQAAPVDAPPVAPPAKKKGKAAPKAAATAPPPLVEDSAPQAAVVAEATPPQAAAGDAPLTAPDAAGAAPQTAPGADEAAPVGEATATNPSEDSALQAVPAKVKAEEAPAPAVAAPPRPRPPSKDARRSTPPAKARPKAAVPAAPPPPEAPVASPRAAGLPRPRRVPTGPIRPAAPPPPAARRPPPPPLQIAAAAEPSEPLGVQLVRHSLRSWTERVRPALLQHPTENNLLVSLGDWGHPSLRLLAAHNVDGAPQVAVAFTPGQPAVVAHLDPKVSPERGATLLRRAEPAHSWPAVYGPVALVHALLPMLQAAPTIGGGPLRPKPLQLWMECRSAGPAPHPGGWMRPARRLDIGTLLPMVMAFSAETGEQDDTAESEGAISWLKPRVEAKAIWVWERPTPPLPGVRRGGADDPGENELVAMVVRSPPTAGRVRLSSVFTRAVDRGRGYAAALVGALTADTLAMSGVQGVILLVDSLNHSARRLYERLGYEARGELARYERLPTT